MAVSFSGIVALVSEERKPALALLLSPRAPIVASAVFAADSHELRRVVTTGSLVLIEGRRLAELVTVGGVSQAMFPRTDLAAPLDVGDTVRRWMAALPGQTAAVIHEAMLTPRAWSVKRVAHAAGISTRQLVRHFHHAGFAVPPKDLLLAARLAAAQRLAKGPQGATAYKLARACGWVDARSLRVALRRVGLRSVSALANVSDGHATVSDFVRRIEDSVPKERLT